MDTYNLIMSQIARFVFTNVYKSISSLLQVIIHYIY